MRPATHVEITLTNETEGHTFEHLLEPLEDDYTPGELYRMGLREYGRCTGRVYVDRAGGPPRAIGWVFESRQRYTDTDRPYLRGAWVIPLVEVEPATPRTMSYALDGEA